MGMMASETNRPVVAVISVGCEPEVGQTFPGEYRWHFVADGSLRQQARQVWISESIAALVFVGGGEALDRAIELLHLLRGTGPPLLVAIAEVPDVPTEQRLRETGAIYLCGPEAHHRLSSLLREMLCGHGAM
jgi:hypothetical protein